MSVETVRTAGVSRGKEATVGLTERDGARSGGGTGRRSCPDFRESWSRPGSEGEARRTLLRRGLVDAELLNEGALWSHVLYSLGWTRRQHWIGVPGALETTRAA